MRYFLPLILETSILILLLGAQCMTSASELAPEQFSLKVKPKLERCVGDTHTRSLSDCASAGGAKTEDIKISLSKCGSKNLFGKNCGGDWQKDLEIDGVKYQYVIRLNRFENAKFKYMLSLSICRQNLPADECSNQTALIGDGNMPYLLNLAGPKTWKNDFRGGSNYDALVLYQVGFEVGEGVGASF